MNTTTLPTTLLTIFRNTDIVLCEREGTYYVNMHFKDLEEREKDKRFFEQWEAFQKWLATEGSDKVVVLMADFNTEVSEITENNIQKIKFTSKKGYVFTSECEKHRVNISQTPFYSTNKTRLFTAQFNKIYVVNTFRIDYIIKFTPKTAPLETIEPEATTQWTMENGKFQPRTYEHEMELGFPSDHDPVLFGSYATWNTCFSGERFDEDSSTHSGEDATNTFEFIPAEYKNYFIAKQTEIIELLTKELGETDLGKLAKKYNSERCPIFDIHLHPKDMPILYLDADTNAVGYRHIEETHRAELRGTDAPT